jgi:hypothetical protein
MVDLTKPDEVKTVIVWAAIADQELQEHIDEGWIVLDVKNLPNSDDDDTFLHTAYTLGKFHKTD